MTYKQFALIFAVWLVVTILIFATPARSASSTIVSTQGNPTCTQAKGDLLAVGSRYTQLKKELEAELDPHFQVVLKTEISAVGQLGGKILMWMTENCKKA